MIGRLDVDLFLQDRFLLNGVSVKIHNARFQYHGDERPGRRDNVTGHTRSGNDRGINPTAARTGGDHHEIA